MITTNDRCEYCGRQSPSPEHVDDCKNWTWNTAAPNGAHRYYEGGDPGGFVAEMKAEFGFDPSTHEQWDELINGKPIRGFDIPAGLVQAVYSSERWVIGS
jgi:hypothetical protein